MADQPASSFTGRSRTRKTRRSVVMIDRFAKSLITFGGIGTILSVLGVALFLVWVVLPLFLSAETSDLKSFDRAAEPLLGVGVDEYQTLGWMLRPAGDLEVFRLDNGEVLSSEALFGASSEGSDPEEADLESSESELLPQTSDKVEESEAGQSPPALQITSKSYLIQSPMAAFGLSDGTLRMVEIDFETQIFDTEDLPAEVTGPLISGAKDITAHGGGVAQITPGGQFRLQKISLKHGIEEKLAETSISRLAHVITEESATAVFFADGKTQVAFWDLEEDLFSGEATFELDETIDLPTLDDLEPDFIAIDGAGREAYLVTRDGRLTRVDLRDREEPYIAESGGLLAPGQQEKITFFQPILGGGTFLWGDSSGRTDGGFTVRPEDAGDHYPGLYGAEKDPRAQQVFARTKSLARAGVAAVSLSSSSRSRLAYAGYENGELRLFNVTNAAEIQRFSLPVEEPVMQVVLSPKENGVLAVTPGKLYHADLDPRFPEAGFSAFFRPVWYEGYARPQHTWQSSSGTDDFEMKLGLMPLIFGTLKATFYSMMFGVPLALLAAIFTSEFLPGKARNVIKPSIEFMASLPSVVLGFLAALVFAPYIEKVVPGTLGLFVTLPVTLLLGAYLWQLLPAETAIRYQNYRFLGMVVLVPLGILIAGLAGPIIENLFFAGDIRGWLAWNPGDPDGERFAGSTGGWMLLCVPLAAMLVAWSMGRFVSPRMRDKSAEWNRKQYAQFDILRFAGAVVVTLGTALVFAWLLSTFGFDPRGSYVDTYVQRNSLIVGFVMGFAIIPIIYTISEDALSTVPAHLRSASLGAGATQWQTAVRIVIPTAMSGLFSAMMVGLGRAVGETMIVLMAAGNTPIMDMNIFEGFRTLSANIAVELPEAVKGDTHYRTLFLAALVLFLMTFVVNTIAEVIRLRFRKRAYQL